MLTDFRPFYKSVGFSTGRLALAMLFLLPYLFTETFLTSAWAADQSIGYKPRASDKNKANKGVNDSISNDDRPPDVKPLQTFRERIEQLRSDCAGRPEDKACSEAKAKLKADMVKLKEICRANPYDESCGAVMQERKEKGYQMQLYCEQNPHSIKCVKKREAKRRREKHLRKYCSKNPDDRRCESQAGRKKRGRGTLIEYCKSHPDTNRCISLHEKMNLNKPKPAQEKNTF